MAGRFEGLSDIEWKLFSNLFPVPGKGERKTSNRPRTRSQHAVVSSIHRFAAGMMCPRGPYGPPEVRLS